MNRWWHMGLSKKHEIIILQTNGKLFTTFSSSQNMDNESKENSAPTKGGLLSTERER